VRGVVGEALAAQRGGAVDAVVVLSFLRSPGCAAHASKNSSDTRPRSHCGAPGTAAGCMPPPRTHVQWPLWSIGVLVNEGVGARAGAREEDWIRGSEHGVL
jgi:hypothetical protein